ncbi:MAG: class I SAM-dependent methyltransferase [Trueperaceae bacterium]|nr:class I SAM-dependent methyltransferase [Trueperaceae bacterium]
MTAPRAPARVRVTPDAPATARAEADALAARLAADGRPVAAPDAPPPEASHAVATFGAGTPTLAWVGPEAPPTPRPAVWGAPRAGRDPLVAALLGRAGGEVHVIDATAGWGTDAVHVARAGLSVTMLERDPLLAWWLASARARAEADPATATAAARVRVLATDAAAWLAAADGDARAVYLDPMYPREGERRAAKRGGAAFLRAWLGPPPDPAEVAALVAAARRVARRVVVKRPAKAPPVAPGASGAVRGRTTRFDVYPPA